MGQMPSGGHFLVKAEDHEHEHYHQNHGEKIGNKKKVKNKIKFILEKYQQWLII